MKQLGVKLELVHWIGLGIAAVLIVTTLLPLFTKKTEEPAKVELKPAAPVIAVESQEAINARNKLSAELASAISRIEELERFEEQMNKINDNRIDTVKADLKKAQDDIGTLNSRLSYQSGAVDTIKEQVKKILEKPVAAIPKRFRLDVVNYKGTMKKKVEEKK